MKTGLTEAKASAEQARSLAPAAPIIYRLLANIHLKEKDYRAAEADIDEYVKLDPDSAAGRRGEVWREVVAQKVDSPSPHRQLEMRRRYNSISDVRLANAVYARCRENAGISAAVKPRTNMGCGATRPQRKTFQRARM